ACQAAQQKRRGRRPWTPRPPAEPDCSPHRSIPRYWRGRFPPAPARPAASTAAARVPGGRGPSSRNLPSGAVLRVLEDDAERGQFIADTIRLGEILGL